MQWEYYTHKVEAQGFMGGHVDVEKIDKELNELGLDGWELVAVCDTNGFEGSSRYVLFTFKRPMRQTGVRGAVPESV